MSGSLYVSAAGAESRLKQLDVVSNNIANSGTTGFRASELAFEAVFEAALFDQGETPSFGRTFVGGTQAALRGDGGPVRSTGRSLDVAIQGDGFFVVEAPAGPRFTRAGAFQVDPDGFLVSNSGHLVLGEGGPISAGPRPIHIEADGAVRDDAGDLIGRLRMDRFNDASALVREGSSLFRAPVGNEGEPVDTPVLVPRSLEGSNVQMVQELARLVVIQRAFDASMRSLQAEDAASSRLIQEI